MKQSRIKALIFLSLIFFAVSCGGGGIYYPGKPKTVKPSPTQAPKVEKQQPQKPAKSTKSASNVFNAQYLDVWLAAIQSVNWIKWNIAFLDEKQGIIRLKEAYAYRKAGKLLRTYTWPSKEAIQTSSINDYLQKIGRYNPGHSNTVFTQENLTMKIIKVTADQTKVEIDYTIRPYTFSGKIGYEIESNGFIESLLLDRIRETLDESPVAKR
ncbi:MAG: hypothetical protein AAF462_08665 [Thermodesulfobacteriota bacterium]